MCTVAVAASAMRSIVAPPFAIIIRPPFGTLVLVSAWCFFSQLVSYSGFPLSKEGVSGGRSRTEWQRADAAADDGQRRVWRLTEFTSNIQDEFVNSSFDFFGFYVKSK